MLAAMVMFALGAGAPGVVTEMTPERIKEAIAAAASEPKAVPTAYGIMADGVFVGVYSTPFSRVVAAARAAKKKFKPFAETDVVPEMLAPEVRVYASSRKPTSGAYDRDIASVEAVVILPKGAKDPSQAIQPIRTEEVTDEYKNMLGGEWTGKSMMAAFPLDALQEGREILVVYDRKVFKTVSIMGHGGCTECRAEIRLDKVR